MLVKTTNIRNYQLYSNPQGKVTPNDTKPFNCGLSCDTVSFSSKINKKLGFSSQLLYKAKIKEFDEKGGMKYIPVKITRLYNDDQEDIDAMKSIRSPWITTPYVIDITDDFQDKNTQRKYKFLALEVDDDTKKLEDRILCLAEVTSGPAHVYRGYHDMEVERIQTAPTAQYNKSNKYKGAGEVLMYGVCKYAKDLRFSEVTLQSTNNIFYDRIGMPKDRKLMGNSWYIFKGTAMDNFIKRVEAKYNID